MCLDILPCASYSTVTPYLAAIALGIRLSGISATTPVNSNFLLSLVGSVEEKALLPSPLPTV